MKNIIYLKVSSFVTLILLIALTNTHASNTLLIGVDNQLPTAINFGQPTNPICMYGCTGKDQEGPYGYNIASDDPPPCKPNPAGNYSIGIPNNNSSIFTITASEHIGGCHKSYESSSFDATITLQDESQLPFTFLFNKGTSTWLVKEPSTSPSSIIGELSINYDCNSYPSNSCSDCGDIDACVNITLSPPSSSLHNKSKKEDLVEEKRESKELSGKSKKPTKII